MTNVPCESRVYLDYNASAPMRPEARAATLAALDECGNASSVHAEGRAARTLVENARGRVARLLGGDPRNVVFVSGATEAANLLLTPSLRDGDHRFDDLWICEAEHPCVLAGHRFPVRRTTPMPVDARGRFDIGALERALMEHDGAVMLALQAANNETGVIHSVAEASRLVHAHGGVVVCDAVQLAGRGVCTFASLGADAIFISSHKLGGPKGAGAIAFARGELHIDEPLIKGGGQERGARGGTENVAAIAGFGAAVEVAAWDKDAETERLGQLRAKLENELRADIPDLVIFGENVPRLANTSAFAVPGISAETLLMALDIAGFAVSSGSACSSGKVKASHVLATMGVDDHIARGALRISLGWASRESDIERFCETFQKTVRGIRARRASLAARI
jgi:cysteine desulfurase